MPVGGGGAGASASGSKVYLSKPADGITRAATTIGAFSTPWQITGVVVTAAQNVQLSVYASATHAASNDVLLCIKRGATQLATMVQDNVGAAPTLIPLQLDWIDETPGAGTYTYEVQAAM